MGTVPYLTIEDITPAVAREWLAKDKTRNRKISPKVVQSYAEDMKAGAWELTMEPISFNGAGLLNGQHRLEACVLAGVPFRSVVARHVPSAARDFMDSGRKRSLADVLSMRDVQQASCAAAITSTLWRIKHLDSTGRRLSNAVLIPIFDRHHKRIAAAAKICYGEPRVRGISYGIIGALCVCCPDDGERFIEVFRTGVPAFKGDPAHALRERLLYLKQKRTPPHFRTQLWTAVEAFNAFRDRRPTDKVEWAKEPVTIEGFNTARI